MKRSAIVLLAVLALPAPPVFAGLFDDKEARAAVERLRVDVDALTERIERASRNQIDFANQSEAVKSELARIRGQVEVLLNQIETSEKRQRDFYVDLDTRLRRIEAIPQSESKNSASSSSTADPVQETRDYEVALGAFKANRYVEANTAMLAFVKNHPNSNLLPNAYYWAASSHFQLHEFSKAIDLFGKVYSTWPNDPKAPDAMLAQSNTLNEAGDSKQARKVMQSLIEQYPTSSAAQTAKQRLKKK